MLSSPRLAAPLSHVGLGTYVVKKRRAVTEGVSGGRNAPNNTVRRGNSLQRPGTLEVDDGPDEALVQNTQLFKRCGCLEKPPPDF